MTNKEAIERLKNTKRAFADMISQSGDFINRSNADKDMKSLELAIQALERGIREKIVIKEEYDKYLDVIFKSCLCPNCKAEIYRYISDVPKGLSRDLECWKCTQRLDWGDTE